MKKHPMIPASDDAWDSGDLGRDKASTRKVQLEKEQQEGLDVGLDLQMISIRLPKALIDDLKMIGTLNGLGYQPLIRQVLTRFVRSEHKRIAQDRIQEIASEREDGDDEHPPVKVKRIA